MKLLLRCRTCNAYLATLANVVFSKQAKVQFDLALQCRNRDCRKHNVFIIDVVDPEGQKSGHKN